jgi:hypothetical protein
MFSIRQLFRSLFSGNSTTTRAGKQVARYALRSSSPTGPKYAGKSASELTHALKLMGRGSMAKGIQKVQTKGVFQGKNLRNG